MKTRAAAYILGRSENWIVDWIVAFITPILLAQSSLGVYFLFGASCLATAFSRFLWNPNPDLRREQGTIRKKEVVPTF